MTTNRTMAEWVELDRANGEGAFYSHDCKDCRNRTCDPATREQHARDFVARWRAKRGQG